MASLWPAQIVCTLGPKSAELSIMEDLLRAGMSVARFNFSHGSHEYHQGTLNTLRQAMLNTRLMCAVLLDTKGPEIRTGMLKGGKPVLMEAGREVTIHTDYTLHGDEHNIAMSYKKLPNDVAPGAEVSQSSRLKYPVLLTKTARSVPTLTDPPLPRNTRQILIGDGSIVMVVLSCHPENGTVRCRCANTAMLGERKNVNLPGVVVDLPGVGEEVARRHFLRRRRPRRSRLSFTLCAFLVLRRTRGKSPQKYHRSAPEARSALPFGLPFGCSRARRPSLPRWHRGSLSCCSCYLLFRRTTWRRHCRRIRQAL